MKAFSRTQIPSLYTHTLEKEFKFKSNSKYHSNNLTETNKQTKKVKTSLRKHTRFCVVTWVVKVEEGFTGETELVDLLQQRQLFVGF